VDHAGDLHSFASAIGLKRRWFQTGGTMPHYDLTRGLRFKAVRQGAIEVTDEQLVAHIAQWRRIKLGPSTLEEAREWLRLTGLAEKFRTSIS
jgi:hypothetical protein